jgi:hypothetical protein
MWCNYNVNALALLYACYCHSYMHNHGYAGTERTKAGPNFRLPHSREKVKCGHEFSGTRSQQ